MASANDLAPVSALAPWRNVVGQTEALNRLEIAAGAPVHAYLLVGSPGSGSFEAALGFAGLILAGGPDAEGVAAERHMKLSLGARHPDLVVVEAEGSALRVSEAEQIIRAGLRSPTEGNRKVIVVRGIDAIEENAIGKLLKVVEEPPPSAVFVLLAEEVPPELITIASRCVRVDFGPLSIDAIATALIERGVDPDRAGSAATAAGGDFGRAELLAGDDGLATRADRWSSIPDRLDGSGSVVFKLVQELRAGMDDAADPLLKRQQSELEELEERVKNLGERGSGRSRLVDKHKRELRRLRSDELRFGLATLARAYRDRLLAGDDRALEPLDHIQASAVELIRNPNEALLLQNLLLQCGP